GSDRQPESGRHADSDRRPLTDGLEIRSHYATVFISVLDDVVQTLPPKAQLVYIQLCRLSYGNKRNYCRVSNPGLARRTNQGVTIVKEAVRHLTQRGLVEVVSYEFSGGERGTTYFVPLPPGTPPDSVRQPESDRRA